MQPTARTSYDEVPYQGHPQTHPARLATIAALFGMEPAPPQSDAESPLR
jgi:hypothetical protein